MRFNSLSQIEQRFANEAAPFLKSFSLPVKNAPQLTLNGKVYSPPRKDYYYPAQYKKERIVLHFTAGNTRSDVISLTQPGRHVSVAFVIARDGTIYQLFSSGAWSGHLGAGIGNQGTRNAEDKATIGIEISNYGYLVPRDGQLETIYSRVKNPNTGVISPPDPYCLLTQQEAYTKIAAPFRAQTYYASYTDAQLESTIILLKYLTAKYDIPAAFLPADKRFLTTNDVLQFRGIVSHVNYRSAGKWDIGPAFDWDQLIKGVQDEHFMPAGVTVRSMTVAELQDEESVEAVFPRERSLVDETLETTDNEGYDPNVFEHMPLQEQP